MRSKPTLLLGGMMACLTSILMAGNGNPTAEKLKRWPFEERRSFATLGDLKRAWTESGIPTTTFREGTVSDTRYLIIAASPYSGVNAIDVYCYVNDRAASWRLYTVTFLPHTETTGLDTFRVDVTQKGSAIEITHLGKVFMTLHLNREAPSGAKGP